MLYDYPTTTPETAQPITIHQHPDGSWFVCLYGQARDAQLTKQTAHIRATLLQSLYEADRATCDRETYGRASALEVALEGRIGDAAWVSRPIALCQFGGWSLPWEGFAVIYTGDCAELWRVERGCMTELVCLYRERKAPPPVNRSAIQALTVSELAAYTHHFAMRQGWPVELAYAYIRFFIEPFALDIQPSADNPDEVLWHYAGTWYASRPYTARAELIQTAKAWFNVCYPHTYADLLAPPDSSYPLSAPTSTHAAAAHTGQSAAAQPRQEAA